MSVILKLCEDIVPDFHVAVTVTARGTVRLAAAVLLSAVIVDLTAGAARTCAMLPEVILFAEPVDALSRDPDLLVPDIVGLIILQIDRRIQSVRIQSDHFGQEFPRPVQGFSLEIISEGEIAQHLEEGSVTRCLADVLDIACTDALLTGGNTFSRRCLRPCEPGLHGSHSCIDQQEAVVIVRNKRETRKRQMILALEIFQIHPAKFIYAILFHLFL